MRRSLFLKNCATVILVLTLAAISPYPTSASTREKPTKVSLYELGKNVTASKSLSIGQVNAWQIFLSHEVLTTGAEALAIDMPFVNGEKVVLHKTSAVKLGEGSFVWRGFIDGPVEQLGEATLTLKNNVMSGRIQTHDRLLMIVPGAVGSHHLVEVDESLFPECGVIEDSPNTGWSTATSTSSDFEPSRAVNGVVTIDVVSLYTPQARHGAGGVAAIEATIQNAVDLTNTAFQNSGSSARLNLVHTSQASYNDSGNIFSDRNWVSTDADVMALRDLYSADMVSLITEDSGGPCGVSFLMEEVGPAFESQAFQVTTRPCAVGNLTYAHEHGHNLGLQHDPANGTAPEQASYPWSFGHFIDGSYRTVMSYSNHCTMGCTRVTQFSNPDISYAGQPTGIAGSRDNHRTLDEGSIGFGTAGLVATFRQTEDNYEENDSLGTAYTGFYGGVWLSAFGGLGIQKDEDWFKVPVNSGNNQLLVDLRFNDADGNIDLEVFDAAGTLLAGSYSHSDDEFVEFTVPTGGAEYYIRIYSEDNQGSNYDLWWRDTISFMPDLLVSSVTVSDTTLALNQLFSVSGTIENQGTGATAPSTLRFYRSTNSTITPEDTELSSTYAPPLAAGTTFPSLPTFPHAPAEPGTYWIGACVDLVPNEISATNNCSDGVEITVLADDYYEENDDRATAYSGLNEQFWLSSLIEPGNQVDEDWYEIHVDSGSERLLIDLPFSHAEGDINIQLVDAAGSILTGAYSTSDNEYIDFAVPSGGVYYVNVHGANRGNSYDLWWDDFTPIDLTVPLVITSQVNLFGHQTFTTWVTVANPGSASPTTSLLRYYSSTDSTISTADIELATGTVPVLGVGGTSDLSTALVAPPSPGIYWIGACVDPLPGELQTHNNCSNGVQITVLEDDAYEENDSMDTAYTGLDEQTWLSTISGSGVQADDDWYEIYVADGNERVLVDLRFAHAEGNIELHLVDTTGFAVARSYSSSDDELIDFVVPTGDARYYIQVFYGNQANSYDLFWQSLPPSTSLIFRDGFESGDILAW